MTFRRYDLPESFPEGEFDLVTASFLQTPVIVEARDRIANGPGGQTATVTDHLILVRKRVIR